MINWKKVELKDRDAINAQICASGCHGADYSFANLYMWREAYQPRIFFNGSRLLVGMPEEGIYAYPKGDGDVAPSIELLLEEAHARGRKLLLRGLTDKTLDEFLPLYGDRFGISEDRDNADYIYTAEKLCQLPGRHLASKRNHINRFLRNGEWELRRVVTKAGVASAREIIQKTEYENPIGIADIDEARGFVERFYMVKGDPELEQEAVAISEMFNNFDELGFRAALLYQKGEAVAFTAGTRLDEAVFDVHFEKALPECEGAYTMINREFARMISGEFREIGAFNREEDMGLEGLRRAKLSYRPDILLMKYFAEEK